MDGNRPADNGSLYLHTMHSTTYAAVPSPPLPSPQAVEDIHLEGGSVLGTSECGECDVLGVVKRLGELGCSAKTVKYSSQVLR